MVVCLKGARDNKSNLRPFVICSQDKYVLSGLIFLFGVAVENGVVVAIPGDSLQKLFDSLCFYIAVGVFGLIHIVFIITVLVKVCNIFIVYNLECFDKASQTTWILMQN